MALWRDLQTFVPAILSSNRNPDKHIHCAAGPEQEEGQEYLLPKRGVGVSIAGRDWIIHHFNPYRGDAIKDSRSGRGYDCATSDEAAPPRPGMPLPARAKIPSDRKFYDGSRFIPFFAIRSPTGLITYAGSIVPGSLELAIQTEGASLE